MMGRSKGASIRTRILMGCLLAILLPSLAGFTFLVAAAGESSKAAARNHLFSLADQVAFTVAPLVAFDSRSEMDRALHALEIDPSFRYAIVYDGEWNEIASLHADGQPRVRFVGRRYQQESGGLFHVGVVVRDGNTPWGYLQMAVSTEAIDRQHRQLLLMAALAVAAALLLAVAASFLVSRTIARPIYKLIDAVKALARGRLETRIAMRESEASDEVRVLSESFNTMAASIGQRNRILESVRFAAQQFLSAAEWGPVIGAVLQKTGSAAEARCALVEERGKTVRYAWPEGWTPPAAEDGTRLWRVPVVARGARAGELVFQRLQPGGEWNEAETDSFHAVAEMLGAAISQAHARDVLIEQVDAKETALTELAAAQQQLIEMSRLSGMAEIATGVLHNVGNVLNSVNVSATLVAASIRESKVDNLVPLVKMLLDHEDSLQDYIARDPKGSRILPYLTKVTALLQSERTSVLEELTSLTDHIDHIKTIVSTQQSYAKVSGLVENVSLEAMIEDAFRIINPGFERHDITVHMDLEPLPAIPADKHKVLQILLNLLRNAKQAVKLHMGPEREIRVRLLRTDADHVAVEIQDSGVGLSAENLTRIFAHGYTTKEGGHGFGLHSGALAAKEMGGSLLAFSEGPGKGATFRLELPIVRTERGKEARDEYATLSR